MHHYTSKSTAMEGAFRPLADLGAKIEQIEAQLASEGMPEEIEPTDAASLDGRLPNRRVPADCPHPPYALRSPSPRAPLTASTTTVRRRSAWRGRMRALGHYEA